MSFNTAVILSVLWLLGAAILGGLIVYFSMRSRLVRLQRENKALDKQYLKLQDEYNRKQKELDLEIRARDRKLEISDEKYMRLQTECQEVQRNLNLQLENTQTELRTLQTSLPPPALPQAIAKAEETNTSEIREEDDKKAQTLAKIREKAKDFDYSNIGLATAEQKDDLKIISGIGPFIEEKLNA
ncbi:MAG: hypothetical protein HC913_12970, partial [Microscillaceae bacterium]|nr:hypothetical protein [Microscillaceae bacterium]